MGHHIDLRMHGVGAPDDDAIGFGHLARVHTPQRACACDIARPSQRDAEGVVHAGIALGMAQAVDAVTHDKAHSARVVIGPDGLRAIFGLRLQECGGDRFQCFIPADLFKLTGTLGAGTAHGVEKAIRVVDTLSIAGYFFANDARGVAVAHRATHPANGAAIQQFHIQRTGGWAIMRADGNGADGLIHSDWPLQ